MGLLKDKVAIITGASEGIGYESARLFAREGAAVVVVARRADRLDALVAEIESEGGRAAALAGDARDENCAREAVVLAQKQFGGLDIGFYNAGTMGALGSVTDIAVDGWQETLDVNLTGAFLSARHQIPALLERKGGALIFTSTFVGPKLGLPGMAAYASAKAGLVRLMHVLAAEYGPQGLRVNALMPGGTETAMGRAATPTPEQQAFVENLHALKRRAQPDEIARSALYLASDLSSFVTGTTLYVDGGVGITRT